MIYESYLSHHGIKGQKWGKQNGPPYPLDKKQKKTVKYVKKYSKAANQAIKAEEKKNAQVSKYTASTQKRADYKLVRLSKLNSLDKVVMKYKRKINKLNNAELKLKAKVGEDFTSAYLKEITY